MTTSNYSISWLTDKTPQEVYDAINRVSDWWSQDFEGSSNQLNDEFSVRFADVHYSKHRVTDLVPGKKIVWQVIDSQLNFLKDKTEWTGTTNIFDITEEGGQTKLSFTHVGLVPQIECFHDCSKGWNYFLAESLQLYIATGQGMPHKKGAPIGV